MLDFVRSKPGADPLVVEGYFACSQQRMFEIWTDPKIVEQWFGRDQQPLHSAEIDLRIGGQWKFVRSIDAHRSVGFEGTYLEIERNKRLVFTWRHVVWLSDGEREETKDSHVDVTFSAKGVGTWIYLVHSGISTPDARKGIGGGWNSSFGKIVSKCDR